MKFVGQQFRVNVGQGSNAVGDNGCGIQLYSEGNDGKWHKYGSRFSSIWLDDLIKQLNLARKSIDEGLM